MDSVSILLSVVCQKVMDQFHFMCDGNEDSDDSEWLQHV
jgi:hypothetical protein